MRRDSQADEVAQQWTLLPGERELLANKTGATRLGFAVLLNFFQCEARFPQSRQEVPLSVVACLAKQVGVPAACYAEYDWQGRAIKYHRAQIRSFLCFREATLRDAEALTAYLSEHGGAASLDRRAGQSDQDDLPLPLSALGVSAPGDSGRPQRH